MVALIFGLVLSLFTALCVLLFLTYAKLSAQELKRDARGKDEIAKILYRAVSYGLSLKIVLLFFGLVSLYGAVVLLEIALGKWLVAPVLIVLALVDLAFVRSKGGLRKTSIWVAAKIAPALTWLTERLHPVLQLGERIVRRFFPLHVHTGLYEKEDIVQLLERQKKQTDNRISSAELALLTSALQFADKTVHDVMIPKRVIVSVSAKESIGPVLMGELHKSGHSRFPVHEDRKDNIIGILYLHDLIEVKQTGTVRDVMRPKVMYVHEDFTLMQTLQAFVKTKQHLFIVVNGFEEFVGVISIEDVLEQVIGSPIVDEFDRYEDLRAVAALLAQKEHSAAEHTQPEAEDPSTTLPKP